VEKSQYISIVAPKQQFTISYLYFPPLTFNLINAPISSDEGMAKIITVLPTVQYPKWVVIGLLALTAVGAVTLLYFVVEGVRWAILRY
jgi:hypothetical protein